MKIGIDLNNVLRDTLKKIEQVYERWFIESTNEEDDFKYEIKSPVTSLDLMSHLSFKDEDHLYNFLYKDFTMEIFGHAGSVEMTTMNDLNDFYLNLREKYDIMIVSDEIGKSKPATLFFISKFGCLIESIKFYSEQTKKQMWKSVDILLTANPELLLNKPSKKMVIKYETSFNKHIHTEHTITNLKELENKIKEIYG
jgi:DNA-binding Lrp family transcriptional regulator